MFARLRVQRHNPRFNADSLPRSLKEIGVSLTWQDSVGLRHPTRDLLESGWCYRIE
jgi:hypothetical protein